MKNVLLFACIACVCFGVAFGGERPGAGERKPVGGGQRPAAYSRDLGPEFATLLNVLAGMRLSDEELNQTQPVTERYRTVLADELEKTRLAVRDKLIEEVRTVLTEDHKVQFDIVVASMRTYEAAAAAATKQFNAKLDELGLSDLKGCQTERDMIMRMLASIEDSRAKMKALYTKFEQAKNESIGKLPPPDANNKEAGRAYYEEKAKLEKAAEAQATEEARTMLTADRQALLNKAVDAQKQWAAAVQAARDTYTGEVAAIMPAKRVR